MACSRVGCEPQEAEGFCVRELSIHSLECLGCVGEHSSRRATKEILQVWCCSVRICAIEFIGRNSRQSNGRTRFAMITYTSNSNIGHPASREHPSTCVETPSSLGRHVRYG
jgi:hypothetical protein